MSKDSKEIKMGAILSYIQMAINVVVGLAYTPMMVKMLGQSEYGLYSTAASVISMLSVLSLGFGSGYVKYFAKYKADNNEKSIQKLNGFFLLLFSIIGIVAFLCGTVLTQNIDLLYKNGLTLEEYQIAESLMFLLTLNLSLSFPMSVFGTIVNANEKFIFARTVNMIKSVVSPLVTVLILFMGYRSVGMVTVTIILTLMADICFVYYVLVVLKYKFTLGRLEAGLVGSMFAYTSFIMINTVVRQINWNAGKVILGRYCGTVEVAIYAVAASLHVYYENFATAISHVFRPRIHAIVNSTLDNVHEQEKQLTDLLITVGRVQFAILGLISTGLVFFGRAFILQYWVGEGYENAYYVTLLLVLPTTFQLIQALGLEVQRALNKHKFRSIVYLFMSVINVAISVSLSPKYGAIGAAVGTAVSVFVVDVLIINIYYQKSCHLNIIQFWTEMLHMSRGLVVPALLGLAMSIVLDQTQLLQFLGGIVCYTAVYFICMWRWALNTNEKAFFQDVLKRYKRFLRLG